MLLFKLCKIVGKKQKEFINGTSTGRHSNGKNSERLGNYTECEWQVTTTEDKNFKGKQNDKQ
jgi:hypothetical protein